MQKYNAPKVKEYKGIQLLTTIWLVPFLALIIALWLTFQYYAKIGPTIEISFKSNAGLIANQSQIKLRDVTIGMVTKISLSQDGSGVIVQARMNKEVESYLNHKAKLWIVHPDVGSHGVSGLDTLISGSYIELHGSQEGESKFQFIGLEKPFIDSEAKGKYYLLSAPNSYNITEGSNVYYRMIKVGRVERVGIAPDGKRVNFTIFVEDYYTPFVNNKSLFYSRSNFSIDFSQAKLDMSIASLSQIIHGGISIYTPLHTLHSQKINKIKKGQVFPIYKSLAEMKEKHLHRGEEEAVYKFVFKEPTNKLEVGSPIKFNGYKIGYVTGIESSFQEKSQTIVSNIFAIIYTKAFNKKYQDNNVSAKENIEILVKHGLKATLNSTLPIIGADFIDLVFNNSVNATLQKNSYYINFPTIKLKESSNIINDTQQLIIKLQQLPIEALLSSATNLIQNNEQPIHRILNHTDAFILENKTTIKKLLTHLDNVIKEFNNTVKNLNKLTSDSSLQELPSNLNKVTKELENTLIQLEIFTQGYNADSKFSAELSATLQELSLAAESIERMSRKLEKKPNALLLGDD